MATETESASSGSAQTTTDHEEIRRWAEERGGRPACVRDTRGRGGSCLLRIDFPGYSGEETLEEIPWDEFFDVFDQNNLVFLYQDRTTEGGLSRFNKLIDRSTAETGVGGGSMGGSRSAGGRPGGQRGGAARSAAGAAPAGSSARKGSPSSGAGKAAAGRGVGAGAKRSSAKKGGAGGRAASSVKRGAGRKRGDAGKRMSKAGGTKRGGGATKRSSSAGAKRGAKRSGGARGR